MQTVSYMLLWPDTYKHLGTMANVTSDSLSGNKCHVWFSKWKQMSVGGYTEDKLDYTHIVALMDGLPA